MTDRLEAFTVRKDERSDKSYWTKIGMAFANSDGQGYSLKLDALPVNGEIVLRVPKPKDDQPQRQERPAQGSGAPAFSPGGMDDDIPFMREDR